LPAYFESAALGTHPDGVVAAAEEPGCFLERVPVAVITHDRLVREPLVHELADVLLECGEHPRTQQFLELCAG
jgi:hypothetical protein